MDLIDDLRIYCQEHIQGYLDKTGNESKYPSRIIDDFGELGLFGLNIPEEHGGYGFGLQENVRVMYELGKVWLSLPALVGTHLRANMYFTKCGTTKQKEDYLPKMAKGELIFSHAYHEKATKDLSKISTVLERNKGRYYLNGSKDWVTNSHHSDKYIVIARNKANANKPVAVIVSPNNQGVKRGKDLVRPGIKGVSLSSVSFNDVVINEELDIIGGLDYSVDQFIETYKLGSSLSFSARAVGAASAVIQHTRDYIIRYSNRESGNEIIAYKYASMYSKLLSIQNSLNQIVENFNSIPNQVAVAYLTKVQCSEVLQDIIRDAIMLKGGYGYASSEGFLQRMYRDAASLPLIDTPNDILLFRSGIELLK